MKIQAKCLMDAQQTRPHSLSGPVASEDWGKMLYGCAVGACPWAQP